MRLTRQKRDFHGENGNKIGQNRYNRHPAEVQNKQRERKNLRRNRDAQTGYGGSAPCAQGRGKGGARGRVWMRGRGARVRGGGGICRHRKNRSAAKSDAPDEEARGAGEASGDLRQMREKRAFFMLSPTVTMPATAANES